MYGNYKGKLQVNHFEELKGRGIIFEFLFFISEVITFIVKIVVEWMLEDQGWNFIVFIWFMC